MALARFALRNDVALWDTSHVERMSWSSSSIEVAGGGELSITLQHTQENLCRAHILAVGAMAGVNLCFTREQDYGVDGQFDPVVVRDGRRIESGFSLPFQAKSTTRWERKDSCIIYDLEAKSFNDMVTRPEGASTLLLVALSAA